MLNVFLYFLVSRLLIWAFLNSPIIPLILHFSKGPVETFFKKLFDCDFCFGFWVCLCTSYFMRIDLYQELALFPPFSIFLTAVTSSFILHIFIKGLVSKFSVIQMTYDG